MASPMNALSPGFSALNLSNYDVLHSLIPPLLMICRLECLVCWQFYVKRTVGQNNQEHRLEYWATCFSVCSFTLTSHLVVCSTLLASLVPYTALTHLLARSLCLLPRWESEWLDRYLICVFLDASSHLYMRVCPSVRPLPVERNPRKRRFQPARPIVLPARASYFFFYSAVHGNCNGLAT